MQKRFDWVINKKGNAIQGASVAVTVTSGGAVATLYEDNGVTPTQNPVRTNEKGYYEYYVADGRYTETITGQGLETSVTNDILIEDPADGSAALANTSDTSLGDALIGVKLDATGAVARTQHGKNAEIVSVEDFGATGDGVTDDSVAIQAAITAIGAAGGGTVYFPRGVYLCSGLTVSSNSVALQGESIRGTRLRFTDTDGTLLTVTGVLFSMDGFEIESPSATHTAGSLIDIQAGQGKVSNIRINGSLWDCFKLETDGAGGWFFDWIRVTGGNTLNSLIRVKGTAQTVADNHVTNIFSATTATYTEGAVILDTYVDTFRITGGTLGGIGKLIHIKDSGGSQDPRYIHIADLFIENSGSTADLVTIDAGDDVRITNSYLGLGLNSVVINAGRDIALKNNHFISCERAHIDYNGGTRVAIEGNTFLDASQETDVTYSTIDIAASVNEWRVEGNTFRLRSGITNKPLRQLTIASGSGNKFFYGDNDWGVAGTDYGAAGAPAVSDASSGTNVAISDNIQTARFRGGAAVSLTGTLTETTLATVTVPAGALRTRDGVRFFVGGTTAGTNNTKTLRLKFGTSAFSTIIVPAGDTDSWIILGDVFNANSQTAQVYASQASRTPQSTEGTVIRNQSGSLVIDTTADITVSLTGQLANTSDTIVMRTFHIDVVRR